MPLICDLPAIRQPIFTSKSQPSGRHCTSSATKSEQSVQRPPPPLHTSGQVMSERSNTYSVNVILFLALTPRLRPRPATLGK